MTLQAIGRSLLLATLLVTSSFAAELPTAEPQELGFSSERLARIRPVIQTEIDRGHYPGAVMLIARHGRIVYHESVGLQDPANGTPMTKDAIFRLYAMTKPYTSVAIMMLMEEGKLRVSDPVSKFLPALAKPSVSVERRDPQTGMTTYVNVPAEREITIQDLLRHTSGLTYEFRGNGPVHKAYAEAKIARLRQTNADQVATLASLPLLHQPGTRWEYGRSTDVLGRLIEVVSGQTLGQFLAERITGPLGMADTGFHVPASQHARLAEGFAKDPDSGADVVLLAVQEPPAFESGGGGMVGTAADYVRFGQMLLNGGRLREARLLGRKTVELMTGDHLGDIPAPADLVPPGHGFGLGFCVRTARGMAPTPGSVGNFFWHGMAGTTFWVDPAEGLVVVFMIQAPGQRGPYRALLRDMVYAAIAD